MFPLPPSLSLRYLIYPSQSDPFPMEKFRVADYIKGPLPLSDPLLTRFPLSLS
jgi:hypothetical protein